MNLSAQSTQIELKKRLSGFLLNPKRAIFFVICAFVFTVFAFEKFNLSSVYAATGINPRMNFQGKVVNSNGTNVTDGNYDMVFKLYTQDSGGVAVWTETWNSGTAQVSVNDGIFRVDLGHYQSLSAIDFNADEYWLSINFNGDGEMSPRVRLTAVPYAFNAQKVAGLTVTDTTGTFTLANLKTFTVNNTLGLSGTDGTTFTFPSTSDTVVTLTATQILINKTIGSTGLTFSGASTDLTTGTDEDLTIAPNGAGDIILTSDFNSGVSVGSSSNIPAVLSVSGGIGNNAAVIIDQLNVGDLLSASASGVKKFTISATGALTSAGYTNNGGILYTSTTGLISQTAGGSETNCLTFTGGAPAWGSCGTGGGSSNWVLSSANGTLSPINNTLDLLFGGTGTQSASFSVLGIAASTNPSASVSAQQGADATKGVYLSGDGSLQSVRNNTLTLGGATTGNINLNPLNSTGTVFINSNTNNANGALKISQGSSTGTSIAISGGAQAPAISISNSFASSGKGLYLSGAVGSGAFGIDIGTVSNQTDGTGIKVNAVRGSGVGLNIDLTSNLTAGSGILINGAADAGAAFTGNMIGVSPTRALSSANIITDTGSYLNLARSVTVNNSSAVLNITGDLANLSSNCTQTSGTCVDTSNLLRLTQSYGKASGAILNIVNSGVGSAAAILSNSGGQSALIIDKTGNAGDIFTASSSGATKFVLDLNGAVKIAGGQTIDTLTNGTLGIGTVNATTFTLGRSGQGITFPGFDCSALGNGGKLTTTSGGVLACSADTGASGGSNWVLSSVNGTLSPINNTLDILVGDTATTTAKFAVLGIAGTTIPTASVSAQNAANQALSLKGDGTIQAARNNTLTLGGDTTGNIIISPNNGLTGSLLTINSLSVLLPGFDCSALGNGGKLTTTSGGVLTCSADSGGSGGGGSNWVLSSANGTLSPINNTLDLLIGGISSQSASFSVLGIADGTNPSASVSAQQGANATKGVYLSGDGSIQSVRNNTLNIGGNTTGSIQFKPANTTAMTINAAGNVGIGTVAPAFLLHLTNNQNGITRAKIENTNTGGSAQTSLSMVQGTNEFQFLVTQSLGNSWSIWNNTANASLFAVKPDAGNGGVLKILGTNNAANDNFWMGFAHSITNDFTDANDRARVGVNIKSGGAGRLYFTTGNSGTQTEKMRIDENGYVGIGTSTPTEKLNVEGGNIKIGSQTDSIVAPAKITQTQPGRIASGGTELIASISASAVFNGSLYVGTARGSAAPAGGAEVYRYDGTSGNWTVVNSTPGTLASTTLIASISAMTVFNGDLYVGTYKTGQAEVYRYNGSTSWTRVSQPTAGTIVAGSTSAIDGVTAMAVYGGMLYIGTTKGDATGVGGAEVYRYEGIAGAWTRITTTAGTIGAAATAGTVGVTSMTVFNNSLIVGTKRATTTFGSVFAYGGTTGANPFTVIAPTNGTLCSNATNTFEVSTLAVYNGKLYAGTRSTGAGTAGVCRYDDRGTLDPNAALPATWTSVTQAAGTIRNSGTSAVRGIKAMTVYNGRLYIGTEKPDAAELYQYISGVNWSVINGTAGTIASGGTASIDKVNNLLQYNSTLFIGTGENANAGAEVYTYTNITDQSYALKFNAASGTVAESNSLTNDAAIWFMASPSAVVTTGGNASTGSFMFSHGLITGAGAYDVAEDYPTRDDQLQPGDLVELESGEKGFVKRSAGKYNAKLVGVYSENPGFRLSQKDELIDGAHTIPVALVGRVPVKVSTESGEIKPGDYLTSSSIPGVAMRATKAGTVIGKAMEGYNGEGIGKVLTYINVSQYLGVGLADIPGLIQNNSSDLAKLYLNLSSTDGSTTDDSAISDILADRIVAGVEVVAPKVSTKVLRTDTISALNEDVSLELSENGTFSIRNGTQSAVVSFDNKGNVVFSGTITADRIVANQIEGLEFINTKISALSDLSATSSSQIKIKLDSFEFKQQEFAQQIQEVSAKLEKYDALNLLTFAPFASQSSQFAVINDGLAVLGTTTLNEASIENTLSIGNSMMIASSSLNVIGSDLEIQSLKQGGISFLGGLISFDITGKVVFKEDVAFEKNVGIAGVLSAKTSSFNDLTVEGSQFHELSATEADASSSAGNAFITAGQTKRKINNPLVKENSLIYVTPLGKTFGQYPYIAEQKDEESFTVQIDDPIALPLKFNYLIINKKGGE